MKKLIVIMKEYNIHSKIFLNIKFGGALKKYQIIRQMKWDIWGKPNEQLKIEL